MADCSAVDAFLTGDICVSFSFKIDLADKVLPPGRELGNSGIQSAVLVFGGDLRLNIVIRREQRIVQVKSVQGAMSTDFLVIDVVLLAVQLNDDVGVLFGNFNLDGFGRKFVLDLHGVSFPLEAAPGGRDTKRADGHDGHTGNSTYKKAWQGTVGTSSSKNPCWDFRFSMYPAASNAHLKALRLNLVGLLAPRVYKVLGTSGRRKRRLENSAPHRREAKSRPSCSSNNRFFLFTMLHKRGFRHEKPSWLLK